MKRKMLTALAVGAALALAACSSGTGSTGDTAAGDQGSSSEAAAGSQSGAASESSEAPAGDQSSESPAAPAELTKITVGVIPIVDTAPIWLGVDKGFFKDEGLDVTIQNTTGGAAAVPGVVSGTYDFAFGNLVSVMVAQDKGLDLRYVANGNSTAGNPDFGGVVVPADSPIKSPKDLAGKTVSVNNLQNIGDTTIRTVVDADGGDGTSVKFVEVAFPYAEAALTNKQIDAAWIVDPFFHAALDHGARAVTFNFSDFDPSLDIAGYFTLGKTISEKPDLVQHFVAAMNKSLQFADANHDEVKRIVTTYTKMTMDQLNDIAIPKFNVDFNRDADQKLADATLKYGTIAKQLDIAKILPSQN
jgi:NitT/TauT family transport system substrate-binding protein